MKSSYLYLLIVSLTNLKEIHLSNSKIHLLRFFNSDKYERFVETSTFASGSHLN